MAGFETGKKLTSRDIKMIVGERHGIERKVREFLADTIGFEVYFIKGFELVVDRLTQADYRIMFTLISLVEEFKVSVYMSDYAITSIVNDEGHLLSVRGRAGIYHCE